MRHIQTSIIRNRRRMRHIYMGMKHKGRWFRGLFILLGLAAALVCQGQETYARLSQTSGGSEISLGSWSGSAMVSAQDGSISPDIISDSMAFRSPAETEASASAKSGGSSGTAKARFGQSSSTCETQAKNSGYRTSYAGSYTYVNVLFKVPVDAKPTTLTVSAVGILTMGGTGVRIVGAGAEVRIKGSLEGGFVGLEEANVSGSFPFDKSATFSVKPGDKEVEIKIFSEVSITRYEETDSPGSAVSGNVTVTYTFGTGIVVKKPDLLIKRGDEPDSAFAINDTYQATPSGDQIETQTVAAGKTTTYQVKVENDGAEANTFILRASENIEYGGRINYKVGSTLINDDITSVGYTTSALEPGGSEIITILLMSSYSSASGESSTTTIEAYLYLAPDNSSRTVHDAVQAVTTVSSRVYPSPTTTSTATHTPVPTSTATVTPTPPPSDYLKYTKGSNRGYGKTVKVGDPISASNGAYQFTMPLISLGGPMDLRFELFYHSDFDQNLSDARVPNPFWWYPYTTASVGEIVTVDGVDKTLATVQLPGGDLVSFKKDSSGNWTLVDSDEDVGFAQYYNNGSSIKYVLNETTEYVYLMDPAQEMMYIFQKLPAVSSTATRIVRIMDRNDNTVAYSYSTETDQNPSRIEDGLGRSFDLTYGDVGGETFLQTVTDHGGRKIQFTYEAQGTDNASLPTLRSVTDAMNQVTTFRYAGSSSEHHIISKELPRGNTPFTQTYESVKLNGDTSLRVVSQKDAQDNTTTLAYDSNANVVTETQPDSSIRKYKHFSQYSLPEKLTDAANNEAKMEKNSSEQLTGVTDRLGDTTSFTYHDETGKLSSITNAKGGKFTSTYTAQSQTITNPINSEQVDFTFYNLTRTDYPDNTSEQFTYDADGNAITRVDQAGKTWTSTYNARGQIQTITNPEGGVATFTYNTDATLASLRDSDTGVTTYTYDTLMRPTTITYPDATSTQIAYNANDQITIMTDEKGNVTTFTYDVNDNLAGITDPADKEMQFTYDDMDRLTKTTDRLGKVTTQTYDALGRFLSVADPTAVKTTFGYDVRGWVNQMTRGGNTWQMGYDDEGIMASATTPRGYTTARQTDKLGFLTGLTDPLNQTITFTRDAMSRITGITDPLGRTTTLGYDSRGLLASVTMPVIGMATYQRDDQGLLSRITDLNAQDWTFTRTAMGRVQSEADPLGNTWQYTYDTLGRISQTTYPDSDTLTRTYDAVGNITRLVYSDDTDLQYTHDILNRLLTANGVTFTRDAEGNVTNTEDTGSNFGAAYDDAGRLKTVTYSPALSGVEGNGDFTVTYTYEGTTGLLTGVIDSLTGTQVTFTYDNDFRPVTITRSNGVNATLTWDNAGRLTRIQDGTFLDLQYTLDAAGQVTKLNMTASLDPIDFLSNNTSNFTYDAASQVSTSGYTYDKRGRLTASPDHTSAWNDASRLIGIDGVTLTYNGLDDLRTRTEGGTTIHYYYNNAFGLNPIMAEQDEGTGQFQRYYVWTPDGQLLYMIDAADGNKVFFFHFDRTGSTLALTDATGTVTDSYAYDPYGRLLAHQGSNPQPFTFVGRWGVRQEDTNGTLYHMRARYYDAVTARFLSRDPVWPQIADPRLINPYQYAIENPLSHIDPNGTFFQGIIKVIFNMLAGKKLGYSGGDPEWPEGAPLFVKEQLYEDVQSGKRDIKTLNTAENKYLIEVEKRRRAEREAALDEILKETEDRRLAALKIKPKPVPPPKVMGQRETVEKQYQLLTPAEPSRSWEEIFSELEKPLTRREPVKKQSAEEIFKVLKERRKKQEEEDIASAAYHSPLGLAIYLYINALLTDPLVDQRSAVNLARYGY